LNLENRGVPHDNGCGRSLRQQKKKLREVVDEKYNGLQQEVYRKEKGRTFLVHNLLNGIASPFTYQIAAVLLSEKFKVSSIATFTGIEDPTKHLNNY